MKLDSNSLGVAYLTHHETRSSFLKEVIMSQLKKTNSAGLVLGFPAVFNVLVGYFDPSLAYLLTLIFIVSLCVVQN
ncbi:hypothetical protein AAV96_14745 [Acinetobacter sp. AG1]|uniref:hypothetical protein n=1 Tax=Acinetobacter TaxID=469 RepID=UPI0006295FC7|nr:hypothetical protein [Acinetobacter sp. AG1]KKW76364.1 hypothetical protein AAV96_14745 [Acinetobacter sp. AG1]